MKRIYNHYKKWEDYQNGMYRTKWKNEDDLIAKSVSLLSNNDMFFQVSKNVLMAWPVSCDENLSNHSCNRRAWVGQAGCCYNHGCPEILTRKAWAMLSDQERFRANRIADKIIRTYEARVGKLYSGVEGSLL